MCTKQLMCRSMYTRGTHTCTCIRGAHIQVYEQHANIYLYMRGKYTFIRAAHIPGYVYEGHTYIYKSGTHTWICMRLNKSSNSAAQFKNYMVREGEFFLARNSIQSCRCLTRFLATLRKRRRSKRHIRTPTHTHKDTETQEDRQIGRQNAS